MPRRLRILLPALGLALAAYVLLLSRAGDLRPHGYAVAAAALAFGVPFGFAAHKLWAWEGQSRAGWRIVVLVAVALRLPLLFTTPTLSDDIYRYIWDGRQQQHGMNPYRHVPDAPEVAELRDELWEGVNHKDVPTIYPPLAEALFLATDTIRHSVFAFKCLVLLFDVALLFVLGALCDARGVPRARTVLYAWHPLVLVELAGSGHNDSLPLFFLVLGLLLCEGGRGGWSLLALGAGTLTKFFGGVVAPLVALRTPRRFWVMFPVVLLLGYLPYAGAGLGLFTGLGTYAAHWEFNHGLFRLGQAALEAVGVADPRLPLKLLFAGGGAGLLGWFAWRRADPVPAAAALIAYALLVSPTVHPWYVVWCVPLLAVVRSPALLCWTFTVSLAYHVQPAYVADGVWEENLWIVALEYVPVFGFLVWQAVRGKKD